MPAAAPSSEALPGVSGDVGTPRFTVRFAEDSDIDGMLGEVSHDLYDGLDYNHADLRKWMAGSPDRRKIWVCIDATDGMVVGWETLKIVDGARTGIPQSLRVHTRSRGQGITKLLGQAQHDYVTTHPTISLLRACSNGGNDGSIALHQKQGFSVTGTQGATILLPESYREYNANHPVTDFSDVPQEIWANTPHRIDDPSAVLDVLQEGGYLEETEGMLYYEWGGYSLRAGTPEEREAAVGNLQLLMEEGIVFACDAERQVFFYFRVRALPRGRALMLTLLTCGRTERFVEVAAPLIRHALGGDVGCVTCMMFYDPSLFTRRGPVPEHVLQTAEATQTRTDIDGFNLTQQGLIAFEKPLKE